MDRILNPGGPLNPPPGPLGAQPQSLESDRLSIMRGNVQVDAIGTDLAARMHKTFKTFIPAQSPQPQHRVEPADGSSDSLVGDVSALYRSGHQARLIRKTVPCQFFARGACRNGAQCQFSHSAVVQPSSTGPSKPPKSSSDSRSPTIQCQFFARGACRNGAQCQFSHSAVVQASSTEAPKAPESSSDSRSNIQCRFFAQGTCTNGDKCRFAHSNDVSDGLQSSAPDLDGLVPETDEGNSVQDALTLEPDDGTRQLYGSLVVFQEGARVEKISLACDFSAVRLDNLPLGTTTVSVIAIATELGFTIQDYHIRKVPSAGGNSDTSFVLRMDDLSFAKEFCAKATHHSEFDAVPIPAALPQSSGWCRVDCKKVLVSWHKPTRNAWLNFGNGDIAGKVSERFSNGSYKILDQVVKSSGPSRGRGLRNALAWTVTLSNVPGLATELDVDRALPSFWKARHIEMGSPSYVVSGADSVTEMFTSVRSRLDSIGPLEWWEATHGHEGKRLKARARFCNDADARSAFSSLNNSPAPFDSEGSIRLTVQLIHSTKLKVSNLIYEAVKKQIAPHDVEWKAQHLLFIAYSPIKGQRVLKIEGVESKQVAEAKQTLEKILRGVMAMKGEEVLWTPSFGSKGSAYDKVKKLGIKFSVVITRNIRKRELRMYGSPDKIEQAEKALVELLEEVSTGAYTIFLDPEQFMWACKGGFKAMLKRFGDKVVAFDVVSSPKRITVTGSEQEYQEALDIVHMKDTEGARLEADTEKDTLCSTCWTEAENPILTRCKHVYCTECFENLCFSGASEDKPMDVGCKGDSGKCEVKFNLEELREYLSSAAFEDLLEASFKNYVRLHPHDLSYCPTPDCQQIYRLSSGTSLFTCPQCLSGICTSCQVDHTGRSCADDKFSRSGGDKELQEIKAELGIKDCPKCQTAMEKISGCDHMTCGGCGTHICWNCMMNFGTSDECYRHMRKTHGGFGLG